MTDWIENKRTALTEMSVNNGMWEIVTTAPLPAALINSAALTINYQVYLFGNLSKPQRFSLKLLNETVTSPPGLEEVRWDPPAITTHRVVMPSSLCRMSAGSVNQ